MTKDPAKEQNNSSPITLPRDPLIAIDVGSGFCKIKFNGGKPLFFQSIASNVVGSDFDDALDADLEKIEIDGKTWIIGRAAKNASKSQSRHDTLQDGWAGSEGWMAILFAAIAKAGETGLKMDGMHLITGIPQAQYSDKKRRENIIGRLTGTKKIKWKNNSITVQINSVTIIPQAAAALFAAASQDESVLEDVFGAIGIGTYTTEIGAMDNGSLVKTKTGGRKIGVSNLIEALKNYLFKEHAINIDVADAPDILMKKKIRHRGEMIDISNGLAILARREVKPILDAIDDLWSGGNELTVFVLGGGAPYFIDAIKESVPHAKIMQDNFFAVANGMLVYLKSQHQHDSN